MKYVPKPIVGIADERYFLAAWTVHRNEKFLPDIAQDRSELEQILCILAELVYHATSQLTRAYRRYRHKSRPFLEGASP